ncbi:MAG: acylphosphatase [Desulfobacula sp.]|nr:acylphosphatase [Desulfobacula sp.]
MPDNILIKLIITGRVQGVFFRAETKKTADRLGINGYVKNLSDGSVEAMLQGDSSIVARMIQWCNKGPAASLVSHIEQSIEQENEQSNGFNKFEIRY